MIWLLTFEGNCVIWLFFSFVAISVIFLGFPLIKFAFWFGLGLGLAYFDPPKRTKINNRKIMQFNYDPFTCLLFWEKKCCVFRVFWFGGNWRIDEFVGEFIIFHTLVIVRPLASKWCVVVEWRRIYLVNPPTLQLCHLAEMPPVSP